MSVFFLGSWGMNRSAGQTNRMNREAIPSPMNPENVFVLRSDSFSMNPEQKLFVLRSDSFPMNQDQEKRKLIPYIYNASNKGPF